MIKLAEVKTLHETNFRDVPGMFRKFANDIESGEMAVSKAVTVVVEPNGQVKIFGWGDLTVYDALAVITRGQNELCSMDWADISRHI